MTARDRNFWDAHYRAQLEDEFAYPAPNPLLFMYTPPITQLGDGDYAVTALDLACGWGQNGLWLAAQGYSVDLIDISRVALVQAQQQASALGLRRVNFLQLDLDQAEAIFAERRAAYDLVAMFDFFRRDLIHELRACVKPGGRIVIETLNSHHIDQDPAKFHESLVEPGELSGYFSDWQLLRHADNGHYSQLVAIKP